MYAWEALKKRAFPHMQTCYNYPTVIGIVEWFHDNGQLFTSGLHENGEREGLWELFDKDGNLTQTEMWENGEPVE